MFESVTADSSANIFSLDISEVLAILQHGRDEISVETANSTLCWKFEDYIERDTEYFKLKEKVKLFHKAKASRKK